MTDRAFRLFWMKSRSASPTVETEKPPLLSLGVLRFALRLSLRGICERRFQSSECLVVTLGAGNNVTGIDLSADGSLTL